MTIDWFKCKKDGDGWYRLKKKSDNLDMLKKTYNLNYKAEMIYWKIMKFIKYL